MRSTFLYLIIRHLLPLEVPCIRIENLLNGYKKACFMDIKLGRRRIPPGAPARTKIQEVNNITDHELISLICTLACVDYIGT